MHFIRFFMHFIDEIHSCMEGFLSSILLYADFKKNKVLTTFGFRYPGFQKIY